MHFRVGGVVELLGHEITRIFSQHFFCPLDGAFHPEFGAAQFSFCAETFQNHPSLGAHVFRHDKYNIIALDGTHQSEVDTRISTCRFNDRGTGFQQAENPGC